MNENDTFSVDVDSVGGRGGVTNGERPACSDLRLQSSLVEVYARFTATDEHGLTLYLVHRKAKFLVTNLVRPLLQVTNETVARLRDKHVVDGVTVGRTSVQVTRLS